MTNPLIEARDQFAARHPEHRVALNGRDWGVTDVGTGPVLVLIPGTLGRGDVFWQQITDLAGHMRILALSYPATGGIADWADDLATLLDQRGVALAHVLGSSLGGYLAQYFAATHPARVETLFAANTLCSVQGLDQMPPYSLDLKTAPIEDLRAGFARGLGAWKAEHPDQGDLVELLMQEVNGRIPEPELRMRLAAMKTAPDLPDAQGRVVTIESADDPLIPEAMRQAVRARLSPSRAYRFRFGGHFPYIARPDFYTALLAREIGLEETTLWPDAVLSEA